MCKARPRKRSQNYKIQLENVKEKYETGMKAMSDAIESAKDISIHPKFSASLSVKSEKSGKAYCDKRVSVDREITLFDIVCAALAVIGAFVAASLIVNAIFSCFKGKKKCCKKVKADECTDITED